MSVPARLVPNEDPCPVSDDLFGQIRRAPPPNAVQIANSLPSSQRAQLAIFCYNKRHLHALGLIIASSCDRQTLVNAGGHVGEVIFDQSREADVCARTNFASPGSSSKKRISLAGPKFT